MTACIICHSNDFRLIGQVYDHKLYECTNCELITVYPIPSTDQLSDYYNSPEYHSRKRYTSTSKYNPWASRISILQSLNKGNRILDVGCATGHFLYEAYQKGFKGLGIDLSEEAIEQAKIKLGKDSAISIDLKDLPVDRKFDIVTMWALIEHVRNPRVEIQAMSNQLRVGGLLAISTPNSDSLSQRKKGINWRYHIPPEHLFCFNKKNITQLLESEGFKVVKIVTQNNSIAWVSKNRQTPNWYQNRFVRIFYKVYLLPRTLLSKVWKRGETMEIYATKTQ